MAWFMGWIEQISRTSRKGIWEYDRQISQPQTVAHGSFPSKGP